MIYKIGLRPTEIFRKPIPHDTSPKTISVSRGIHFSRISCSSQRPPPPPPRTPAHPKAGWAPGAGLPWPSAYRDRGLGVCVGHFEGVETTQSGGSRVDWVALESGLEP